MEVDINTEYERIFGTVTRPTLYEPDDADYLALRQFIIEEPKLDCDEGYIPFKDICFYKHEKIKTLTPEKSKQISKTVKSPASQKISQPVQHSRPNIYTLRIDGLCNASGHFDQATGLFIVMRNSSFLCKVTDRFASSPIGVARQRFIETSCQKQRDRYIVKEDTVCKSASAAASYLLGKISSVNCWKLDNPVK